MQGSFASRWLACPIGLFWRPGWFRSACRSAPAAGSATRATATADPSGMPMPTTARRAGRARSPTTSRGPRWTATGVRTLVGPVATQLDGGRRPRHRFQRDVATVHVSGPLRDYRGNGPGVWGRRFPCGAELRQVPGAHAGGRWGRGIPIALLWPTVGWPPEVDFYEDSPTNNTRPAEAATLHYSAANTRIQKRLTGVDFTQWHTLGVEWTPAQLVYTIDGQTWATVTGTGVPSVPMKLDLQTQFLPDHPPSHHATDGHHGRGLGRRVRHGLTNPGGVVTVELAQGSGFCGSSQRARRLGCGDQPILGSCSAPLAWPLRRPPPA